MPQVWDPACFVWLTAVNPQDAATAFFPCQGVVWLSHARCVGPVWTTWYGLQPLATDRQGLENAPQYASSRSWRAGGLYSGEGAGVGQMIVTAAGENDINGIAQVRCSAFIVVIAYHHRCRCPHVVSYKCACIHTDCMSVCLS